MFAVPTPHLLMPTAAALPRVVSIAIAAVLAAGLLRQCRKPGWLPGRLIALSMNLSHRPLTSWALGQIETGPAFAILDVGCGGGATVARLAALAPQGRVQGIDYSAASVATARHTNRRLIQDGRVTIELGSVSALPFETATFDLITAIETHYYWPNLESDLREMRRVLRPGGTFMLVAETYRNRRADWLYRPAMALLRATYLTPEEHRTVLRVAGFERIRVAEHASNGWICAIGRNPSGREAPGDDHRGVA